MTNPCPEDLDALHSGYAYDDLGRTTTVPSSDAVGIGSHNAKTGTLTVGYYVNDLVASQTQGGDTVTFGLDPMQNRFASTTESATSTTTTNHYADSSDSPIWASTSGTVWTRNLIGIDGSLAGTVDQTGTVVLNLANLHGDIVATAADDLAATNTTARFESTEFGGPRTPASAPDTYGYVGAKRRSTNDLGGLTLMGVRLYNPATGRFLSVDPVPGGNDNPYVYPTDPIDGFDLDGRCGLWGHNTCMSHVKKFYNEHKDAVNGALQLAVGAVALAGCSFVCAAAGAVSFTWSAVSTIQAFRSGGVSAGLWSAVSFFPVGGKVLGRVVSHAGGRMFDEAARLHQSQATARKVLKLGRTISGYGRIYDRYGFGWDSLHYAAQRFGMR